MRLRVVSYHMSSVSDAPGRLAMVLPVSISRTSSRAGLRAAMKMRRCSSSSAIGKFVPASVSGHLVDRGEVDEDPRALLLQLEGLRVDAERIILEPLAGGGVEHADGAVAI